MSVQQCIRCAKNGNRIRITAVDVAHPSARKLMAMGIDRGCDIRVERVSPFGDPCMIQVKGYSLALRRRDFEALHLEICGETEA
jgi:Fe2+ transport system protein FeoA